MLSKGSIGTKDSGTLTCTWQNMVLYALGVGAEADELSYIYEKELKVIPTIATMPNLMSTSTFPVHALVGSEGLLHMSNELIQHRSFPTGGGTLHYEREITELYDMGKKGTKLVLQTTLYDGDRTLISTCADTILSRQYGNWGGDPPPKTGSIAIPDRSPDREETCTTAPTQPHLFRIATGDYCLLHVDTQNAIENGFPQTILHGFGTYGFACRMAIKSLFPGEPERLRKLSARFTSVLCPGQAMRLQLWNMEPGKAYFRLMNQATGAVALDRGEVEWAL